jgi:UvrD/REP helicase N-terminal domain
MLAAATHPFAGLHDTDLIAIGGLGAFIATIILALVAVNQAGKVKAQVSASLAPNAAIREAARAQLQPLVFGTGPALDIEHGIIIDGGAEISSPRVRSLRVEENHRTRSLYRSALTLSVPLPGSAMSSASVTARALVVDEVFDANRLDLAIVELAMESGLEVTIIGDPWQALYGFRGARPEDVRGTPRQSRQSCEQLRVTAVGLDPVPTRPGDLRRRRDHAPHPAARECPRELVPGRTGLIRHAHGTRQPGAKPDRLADIRSHPELLQLARLDIQDRRHDLRGVHIQAHDGSSLRYGWFLLCGCGRRAGCHPHGYKIPTSASRGTGQCLKARQDDHSIWSRRVR